MKRLSWCLVACLTLLFLNSHLIAEDALENINEEYHFLRENKEREGVKTTASGLQYEILKSGSGKSPTTSSTVAAHYRGTTLTGGAFDSSYDRLQPTSFHIRKVIAGWTEALLLMKEGDKWKIYVPSKLAYGAEGRPPKIGPNKMLIFEIELVEVR
jgi:FKBP-type peptidyl-prolyl cis-trans isomerase FklB